MHIPRHEGVRILLAVCGLLSALTAAAPAGARPGLELAPQTGGPATNGPAAGLSRDMAYWRGEREVSPGPFLSLKPAATGVTVVCDRWPDCSDLKQFGLDAARLSEARTDHEKCLAVWQWVRRCTMCTNGTPPLESFKDPIQTRKNGYIDDPIKVLNVYGTHWCDGLSQAVAAIWRAMGYRAEKLFAHGHTLADCYYRDFDGVERWHWYDVSEGAFMLDRTGRRLVSPDELITDLFSDWCGGWIHCQHLDMPTHRIELSFRTGEGLQRDWSNWGKPYQNNVGKPPAGDREHGPYKFGYGNGRWTYKPDLAQPGWTSGLAAAPEGLVAGRLMPAEAGTAGAAVWRFRTPFIVSDAQVNLRLFRKSGRDAVRLHLSVDDGKTWKPLWECPADVVGAREMVVPICETFQVLNNKTSVPPEGFNSPFGRYHYRLKLELVAAESPSDCRVEGIEFRTTVQQNYYSLPQLQPGRNRITVKGELAERTALKVTYVWDDPAGKGRRNVTVVERAPYTYEIVAGGSKWEDCVCKSLTVEAVAATGGGNRTEIKEAPAAFTALPPIPPAPEVRERTMGRNVKAKVPPVEELLKYLESPETMRAGICGLVDRREPRGFEGIRKILYEVQPPTEWNSPLNGVKEKALAGLYVVGGEKARPVLLEVVSHPERTKWKEGRGLNGIWPTGALVIGYVAADAGWKEFAPPLAKVLDAKPNIEVSRGLVRVLGRLGNPAAAESIRRWLAPGADADAMSLAALSAGQVGDKTAIPRLRELLRHNYPPVSCNAAAALGMLKDTASGPGLRRWLVRTDDENFRGVAAEALGAMGEKESIPALEAALSVEPFPWVREEIERALNKLR